MKCRGCGGMWERQLFNDLIRGYQCFFTPFYSTRALYTYEGNTNDIRLAGKGGERERL